MILNWRQPPQEHCSGTSFDDYLRQNLNFNQFLEYQKKQWMEEEDKKKKAIAPKTVFQRNQLIITWWLFFLSPFGMMLSYYEVQFMFKLLQAYGLK